MGLTPQRLQQIDDFLSGPHKRAFFGQSMLLDIRAALAESERVRKEQEGEIRKAVASWMIAHGFTTGHGDTLVDLLNELGAQTDTHRRNYMDRIYERDSLREQLAAAQSERDEWISLAGEYAKFNSELHTQPPGTPEGMRVKQLGARYSSRADGTVFMMAELEPLSPSAESAKPMEDARHE